MWRYPKGCRWHTIVDGVVSEMQKKHQPTNVEWLADPSRWRWVDTQMIVVQPRGKCKWWLFEVSMHGPARFIAAGKEPDALNMRAVLGLDA